MGGDYAGHGSWLRPIDQSIASMLTILISVTSAISTNICTKNVVVVSTNYINWLYNKIGGQFHEHLILWQPFGIFLYSTIIIFICLVLCWIIKYDDDDVQEKAQCSRVTWVQDHDYSQPSFAPHSMLPLSTSNRLLLTTRSKVTDIRWLSRKYSRKRKNKIQQKSKQWLQ